MERCPNCDTPGRPGAKFCTTCGFRFPEDESTTQADDESAGITAAGGDGEPEVVAAETIAGWPSPPATGEELSSGWDQQTVIAATAPTESGEESTDVEASSTSWPEVAVDPWPAPPAGVADPAPIEPEPLLGDDFELESADELGIPDTKHVENAETMKRAMRLLDELRDTITGIGPNRATDFSEVISELEIAVTPPGAMATDDVAELREALLAARERPRDVDTIVDLTKRIDAMVALVFAYDRSIAAIERSLDTLRGDGG